MVKVNFEKYRKYFILSHYTINDNINSHYEIKKDCFILLKRNSHWVFEGNPFASPPVPFKFYGQNVKEIENGWGMKNLLFEFESGDNLSFFFVKNNGDNFKIQINGKKVASVVAPHCSGGEHKIIIKSNEDRVIDMCLFAFMYIHNYDAVT